MHLSIVACDLDGTLTEHEGVAPETWQVLRQMKNAGLVLILVTGRILDTFEPQGPYAELCEAIVAEDGAVVYFPHRDRVMLPFGKLDSTLLQRLEGLDIPFQRGTAIRATQVPHDQAILEVLQDTGGGATVEYNQGAVMVLPPGATKGTGLLYALRELDYSPRNVIACGNAENDRSLFEVAEVAVAVANAAPNIQANADVVLDKSNGRGVRHMLRALMEGVMPKRTPRPERQLNLGKWRDGSAISLDPFALVEGNLGIMGTSGSGKSWLAGLLVEELLKQGYQLCVIDPEGDYRAFQSFSNMLLMGSGENHLPVIRDIVMLFDHTSASMVLDLSAWSITERQSYVLELLHALSNLQAQRGRPHWILLDEIQSFCPQEGGPLTDLLIEMTRRGGLGMVTYRPSHTAAALLKALDHWIFTRLNSPEDIEAVKPFLDDPAPASDVVAEITNLPQNQAYFYFGPGQNWAAMPEPNVGTLQAELREIPHIRHLYKYLRLPLPEPKRFYFSNASGTGQGYVSANLWEFWQALQQVPLDSLQYHLKRRDFERWLERTLHDHELARRVRKSVHRHSEEGEVLRQALVAVVADRYTELEDLI